MSEPPSIPDHTLLRPIGRGAYGEVWLAQNVMGVVLPTCLGPSTDTTGKLLSRSRIVSR